jgi:hypothetical protein
MATDDDCDLVFDCDDEMSGELCIDAKGDLHSNALGMHKEAVASSSAHKRAGDERDESDIEDDESDIEREVEELMRDAPPANLKDAANAERSAEVSDALRN